MSNQPRAMFIDDDPVTLGVLERMLRNTRGQIDPVFVDNGNDAVEMLTLGSYDVVVTCPGRQGSKSSRSSPMSTPTWRGSHAPEDPLDPTPCRLRVSPISTS